MIQKDGRLVWDTYGPELLEKLLDTDVMTNAPRCPYRGGQCSLEVCKTTCDLDKRRQDQEIEILRGEKEYERGTRP